MPIKKSEAAKILKCGYSIERFEEETWNGYKIAGWMSRAENFWKGSLLIDTITEPNGRVRESMEYVQGMPKIMDISKWYRRMKADLSKDNVFLTEKLDGTNIVFYPIFIDGEVVDVCVKTRGLPLIRRGGPGEKWMELIKEACDIDEVVETVYREPYSYAFELHGSKNQIGVNYDFPIRMTLISVMKWGWIMEYPGISRFGLDYVKPLFEFIDDRTIEFREGGEIRFNEVAQLPNKISRFLDAVNESYKKIYEGVVWNISIDGRNHLYKNKSYMAMPLYRDLRKSDIRRLIWEAIHIYGVRADRDEVLNFVVRSLEGDYGRTFVGRWVGKIAKTVEDEVRPIEYSDFLQKAYESVSRALNGKMDDITLVMRTFAELYPDMKRMSSKFYRYVIDRGMNNSM